MQFGTFMSVVLFFQGKWSVTIGFVVGNQIDDNKHIEVLTSAVTAGSRRLFSMVTKDELYSLV